MKQSSIGGLLDNQPAYRLFFGIWPDAPAAESLVRLMTQLQNDGVMSGRPVDKDRLHATLHHLGDFVDQVPPYLLPGASGAADGVRWPAFEVVFDRVGGTRGMLLLRASDGSPALKAFRQNLSIALTKSGLGRYANANFNPHITLSYDYCDIPERSIEPIRWTVREFVLVESLLGKHQHNIKGRWQIHG